MHSDARPSGPQRHTTPEVVVQREGAWKAFVGGSQCQAVGKIEPGEPATSGAWICCGLTRGALPSLRVSGSLQLPRQHCLLSETQV